LPWVINDAVVFRIHGVEFRRTYEIEGDKDSAGNGVETDNGAP
jgi:hypothetical protein